MKRPLAISHAVIRHLCSAGREASRRQLEVGVGRHSAQLRQLRSSTALVETPTGQTTRRHCCLFLQNITRLYYYTLRKIKTPPTPKELYVYVKA